MVYQAVKQIGSYFATATVQPLVAINRIALINESVSPFFSHDDLSLGNSSGSFSMGSSSISKLLTAATLFSGASSVRCQTLSNSSSVNSLAASGALLPE